jgi:hypothetical protein
MSVTLKAGQIVKHTYTNTLCEIVTLSGEQACIKMKTSGKLYVVSAEQIQRYYEDVAPFYVKDKTYKFKGGSDKYLILQVTENTNPLFSCHKFQATARCIDAVHGRGYLTVLDMDDFDSMVEV